GARELQRRQARGVENLVRVGVADAAEKPRIGQRAFHRVVLARQGLSKLVTRDLKRLDAARIERSERRLALHELHRRALLRSGFGQPQRAVRELKRGEHDFRAQPQLFAARSPTQPAGNHQMNDQKEVRLERQDDPLADAADASDFPTDDRLNRRRHRPQDEWTLNMEPLQRVIHDGGRQRLRVDDDIREFGHLSTLVQIVKSWQRGRRNADIWADTAEGVWLESNSV